MRVFILLTVSFSLLLFISACTNQRKIVDAQLIQKTRDYSNFDQLSIGFNFEFSNGKSRRTRNLEEGQFPLRRFSIKSPYGQFKNGRFLLNENFLFNAASLDSIPILLESKSNDFRSTFYLYPSKPAGLRVLINNSNTVKGYGKNTTTYQLKFEDGKWRTIDHAYQVSDKSKLFKLYIDGYSVEGSDSFWLNQTPQAPIKNIDISAVALFNPTLKYRSDFSIDYRHSVSLDYSGAKGQKGRDGVDGSHRYSPTRGEDGYRGEDGWPVNVFIDYRDDQYDDAILSVWIVSPYSESHYWFAPNKSSLTIISRGGRGGSGGFGGDGLDGTPEYPEGETGAGGGNGGDGGRGGEVNLYFTPLAFEYQKFISIDNEGGKGGYRGAGGRGGTNWTEERKSFLVAVLNLDSGGRGLKGDHGNSGPNGPPPGKYIISSHELHKRLQATGIEQKSPD